MNVALENDLRQRIERTARSQEWSFAVLGPEGVKPVAAYNPDTVYLAHGLGKLAIATAGELAGIDHHTNLVMLEDDLHPDSDLAYRSASSPMPYASVLRLMLAKGDETATRMAVRAIGGPEEVNSLVDTWARETLGRPVRPALKILEGTGVSKDYEYGTTTPLITALLMRKVCANPALADILRQGDNRKDNRGLRQKINPELRITVPHKKGHHHNIEGNMTWHNEVAMFGEQAIAVLSRERRQIHCASFHSILGDIGKIMERHMDTSHV